MSMIAMANADGSVTVVCGKDALNVAVVGGQLVVSAAPPAVPAIRRAAAPPPPPPPPKPVVIPGPPATGPRTMIRVPGFGDRSYDPIVSGTLHVGAPACFQVMPNEWVDTHYVWERVCSIAEPGSMHFYFPIDVSR